MLSQFKLQQLSSQEKSFLESSKRGEYLDSVNPSVLGQAHNFDCARVVSVAMVALEVRNLELKKEAMKNLVDHLEPSKMKFACDNAAYRLAFKLTQYPESKHYTEKLEKVLNEYGRN